jgi:hypothetical protein
VSGSDRAIALGGTTTTALLPAAEEAVEPSELGRVPDVGAVTGFGCTTTGVAASVAISREVGGVLTDGELSVKTSEKARIRRANTNAPACALSKERRVAFPKNR